MQTEYSKPFVTILLLGLSLLTALMLESKLTTGYIGQLVVILIGVVITLTIIFGLWVEADWAYPLATVLFAGALANLLWLFSQTQSFLLFAFGLLVNIAGLVGCLVCLGDDGQSLETYNVRPAKRTTRRKAAKRVKRKKKHRR